MPQFIDYTGRKIGRVQILEILHKKSSGIIWKCKCDCGLDFTCWGTSFKRGEKFECRECCKQRLRVPDLTGRKFGRWTVLYRSVDKRNKTCWYCRCDCGKQGFVDNSGLGKKGKSMSCGCLGRKEKSKHVNPSLYPPAHGLSKSKFYAMKTSLNHKCYNPKHPTYKLFGAKGITVCDVWRNGARDMYDWAKSQGWEEGDIFCLKEGEKEFNPTSVFILKENEFHSHLGLKGGFQITYNGETHSISKWAELFDVDKGALRRKIMKLPTVEEAFGSYFIKWKFKRDPTLTKTVIDLYQSGKTQEEIAKIIGQNSQNVRYHLVKNNVELRPCDGTKKPKRSEITNEQIIELLSKGMAKNAIARELGCSYPTIDHRIKKMNGIKRDRSKG